MISNMYTTNEIVLSELTPYYVIIDFPYITSWPDLTD